MRIWPVRRFGRLIFVGDFVIAFSRGHMGYRHTRLGSWFKICRHTCPFCGKLERLCHCFEELP